jgi:hypothetical protein
MSSTDSLKVPRGSAGAELPFGGAHVALGACVDIIKNGPPRVNKRDWFQAATRSPQASLSHDFVLLNDGSGKDPEAAPSSDADEEHDDE